MSLMDVRRSHIDGLTGLDPPPASLSALWKDLTWHNRIYRMEGLPLKTRLAFLGLRIVQRIAYNTGWHRGCRL